MLSVAWVMSSLAPDIIIITAGQAGKWRTKGKKNLVCLPGWWWTVTQCKVRPHSVSTPDRARQQQAQHSPQWSHPACPGKLIPQKKKTFPSNVLGICSIAVGALSSSPSRHPTHSYYTVCLLSDPLPSPQPQNSWASLFLPPSIQTMDQWQASIGQSPRLLWYRGRSYIATVWALLVKFALAGHRAQR